MNVSINFYIIPLLILGCKPNYQENIKFLQRLETLNMDIYSKDEKFIPLKVLIQVLITKPKRSNYKEQK